MTFSHPLFRRAAALAVIAALSGCRHHHHHSSLPPTPTNYSVGGNVTGLNGTVVLRDNGGDDLTVTASGAFKFATSLATAAAYNVTVQAQPTGQTCAVASGSGTIGSANVTNIAVTCTTNTYTIGGSASGLTAGGLVLQDNGADDLTVGNNGAFTFATHVAFGAAYAVTVKTQPTNQTCAISSGSGTVAAANVTSVAVTCTTNTPPPQSVGILKQIVTSGVSPAISDDGRYVTYQTAQTSHVELVDTCSGNAPAGCATTTAPISVTSNGTEIAHTGNALARTVRNLSDDGRLVVFDAQIGDFTASPSVPASTHEVYLRDTCNGQPASCVPTTQLISVGSGTPSDRDASDTSISSDGRVIIFESQATNLGTSNPTSANHVYSYDTCIGAAQPCTPAIRLVSVGGNSQPHAGAEPAADESGRFIAFGSVGATSDVTSHLADIYLRYTCVGASAGCTPSTILISAPRTGATPSNGYADHASVANGGRFVLFDATASDLVATPDNAQIQVYLRDTCIGASGACTPSTQMISVDSTGNAGTLGDSYTGAHALFSASGRYVAFTSRAQNLSPLVANGPPGNEAYVRDTCFGASGACTPTTHLISVDSDGNLIATGSASFQTVGLTGDGRYALLYGGITGNEIHLALTGF